jgi:magnesium-transporting ATPase (P-type)
VAELRSSGSIAVAMVTGDSVLTAAHVALEVGILGDSPKAQQVEITSKQLSSKKLKRVKRGAPLLLRLNAISNKLEWIPVWDDAYDSNSSTVSSSTTATATAGNSTATAAGAATTAADSDPLTTSSTHSKSSKRSNSSSKSSSSSSGSSGSASAATHSKLPRPFRAAEVDRLSRRHDLCVTGDALKAALQCAPELVRAQLHAVRIFARMTPAQKEIVATAIKVSSHCCSTVTARACAIGTIADAAAMMQS